MPNKSRTMKPYVLVAEDDESIITLLKYTLEKADFEVAYTKKGEDVLLLVDERKPDIILLDWMLPGTTGIELCGKLRRNDYTKKIPIIMISAKGEELDRIEGLEKGADDYIVKPFSPKELIARINAVFRRIRPAFVEKILSYGEIQMDVEKRLVTYKGEEKQLGPIEYKMLQSLLEYPKRVLSRDQLIRRVWGCELSVEPRTVDVHINRLRKAVGLEKSANTVIKTIRSSGYCIKNLNENDNAFSIIEDNEISDDF